MKKDAECYWEIKGRFNIIIIQENTQFETIFYMAFFATIGGLQPISRDPKDNDAAAMLDDRTFYFAIQQGRHGLPLSFWISRDWLQTTNTNINFIASSHFCTSAVTPCSLNI